MPIHIPYNLPAADILRKEGIHLGENTETESDSPLRVLLLNLMPVKTVTETDFARVLSSTRYDIELVLMRIAGHVSKNTSQEHLDTFYKVFSEVKDETFDGMIITGAPVELLPFEDVTYWNELKTIFDWARMNVRSTLYICWAAQAGLYHFYNIPKYTLPQKKFGVFEHVVNKARHPLFTNFGSRFGVPHSRHTEIRKSDIEKCPELDILAESEEAGVHLIADSNGRDFFITGHAEYPSDTLDNEYMRDMTKGLPIHIPAHYYRNDNPTEGISARWDMEAQLLFNNWIEHYVSGTKI